MNSRKDYIDYVRDVLGIKNLHGLRPKEAKKEIQIPLVIYVEDYGNYLPEEKDLLQKMLSALKIPTLQMLILDLNDSQNIKFEGRITLTNEKSKRSKAPGEEIHTYSPRTLLKNPALKKVAWEDLQKILPLFQSKI